MGKKLLILSLHLVFICSNATNAVKVFVAVIFVDDAVVV